LREARLLLLLLWLLLLSTLQLLRLPLQLLRFLKKVLLTKLASLFQTFLRLQVLSTLLVIPSL